MIIIVVGEGNFEFISKFCCSSIVNCLKKALNFLNSVLCYLGSQKLNLDYLHHLYANPLIFVYQSNFPKDPNGNV